MDTAVKVFQIVQAVVGITGLVWVLAGIIDFFGGRNNNDSMRQEKGANAIIGVAVCQAIIAALHAIS